MTAFTSNWLVFFPLAFSLFVAMRLAEGSADRGQTQLGQLAVRGLIGVLFLFAILAVGLRASPLGLTWIGLLAVFTTIVLVKNRRLKRSAWLLTALHTKRLNEQALVCDAFAAENRGWARAVGRALGQDLHRGFAWWTALEKRGVAKGVYEQLAVRLIARYGPPSESNRLHIEPSATSDPLQIEAQAERLLARLFIFFWVGIAAPLVVAVLVFVFPTLTAIFEEFDLQLPPAMRFMMGVADSAAQFGWASVLYLVPIAWLLLLGLATLLWIFPQLMQLPPLRWLARDYYRNAGFVALAWAVQQEPTLTEACRATGQLVSIPGIGLRYRQAADLLSGGMQPRAAFLRARLVSQSELKAFGVGFDHRDPAWSLQQLAEWKTTRMLYRYGIAVQIGVVLLTLCLAAMVGCIAVGVFQVLSTMIQALA